MVNRILIELKNSKADTSRIRLLIDAGKYHIYKPGEAKIDLDSGLAYLNQAKKLSDSLHLVTWRHQAESMLMIADMEAGNNALGRRRFAQIIDDCRKTDDKAGEATTRFRLAVWLRNSDPDYRPVFANFRQAAALYRSIGNQEEEIRALKEIAATYLFEGQLDSAETKLVNVLNQYKSIGYAKLHYTYSLLASVSSLKGDYEKGLRYALLCIDSMNKTADTVSAATFYGDLGRIYEEVGNYPKSIEWHKKSLAKWRQEKLPNFAMYNTGGFLAKALIKEKKPQQALHLIKELTNEIPTNTVIQKACVSQNLAYCYDALHNNRLAEQYYKETLAWYANYKLDFEASLQAEQDIGAFYVKQGNFIKAGDHLKKVLNYSSQKNSLLALRDIHYLLFKVDSAQGNYFAAIQHFRLHKALNDSLFNETKSKQIAQLEVQYETQKKVHDITLLSKQSKLQQSELIQGRITRNSIIIVTLLLTGLLVLGYNRYRLKQRSNQLLEAKQTLINQKNEDLQQLLTDKDHLLDERDWMLKEIHHRVKNNLQTITSLLRSQSVYLKDTTALAAIRESQNRVHAMALIHQKLYQSEQLTRVPMAEYVQEIVEYLIDSFDQAGQVNQQVEVDTIALNVTQAVPLGLIINEAVTNALKYAFPTESRGQLTVRLHEWEHHGYQLLIEDNGVGLPADFDATTNRSLGINLMRGLSKQLRGTLQISQGKGVQIKLIFSQEG